jgi:hypothetical protein
MDEQKDIFDFGRFGKMSIIYPRSTYLILIPNTDLQRKRVEIYQRRLSSNVNIAQRPTPQRQPARPAASTLQAVKLPLTL